jgi:hypothetical protein
VGHATEVFVGIDVSKLRNAIAVADGERGRCSLSSINSSLLSRSSSLRPISRGNQRNRLPARGALSAPPQRPTGVTPMPAAPLGNYFVSALIQSRPILRFTHV